MREQDDRLEELGINVLVVTFDADFMAKSYVEQTKLPWPLLIDSKRELYRAYGMERADWWSIYGPASIWHYVKLVFGRGRRIHHGRYTFEKYQRLIVDVALGRYRCPGRHRGGNICVAYNAVHGPLNVPERYKHLDARDAMLKALDDGVGEILHALDIHGIRDNTLLVFTNDNGPVLEEMSKPYRGTKNTTFEGGVRSPAIVRWPGHTEAGSTNNGMMFVADWFSTFISIAGASHKQATSVDALDMQAMLFQGKESPRDEVVYDVVGSVRLPTIRKGDYKLMGDALYNIVEDPSETTDIAAQHPDLVAKLKARVDAVGAERPPLGDKPLLMDPPLPYVYGIEENQNPPQWLKDHVDAIRAAQPQSWAPGETPWPKAPQGAVASKMTGGIDEVPVAK